MAEFKIKGREFRVFKMPATKAIVLQARLVRFLGPAANQIPSILRDLQATDNPEKQAAAQSAAIKAFADIFMTNEAEEIAQLVIDIASLAQIKAANGMHTAVDVDREFTECLEDLPALLVHVLKEQFGSFFSALPVLGNQGPAR